MTGLIETSSEATRSLSPPLLLIVGTPSAFGTELAYRLRAAKLTLMDIPICF